MRVHPDFVCIRRDGSPGARRGWSPEQPEGGYLQACTAALGLQGVGVSSGRCLRAPWGKLQHAWDSCLCSPVLGIICGGQRSSLFWFGSRTWEEPVSDRNGRARCQEERRRPFAFLPCRYSAFRREPGSCCEMSTILKWFGRDEDKDKDKDKEKEKEKIKEKEKDKGKEEKEKKKKKKKENKGEGDAGDSSSSSSSDSDSEEGNKKKKKEDKE
ncbi:pre-mRNA-splicing factor 38B-like isoform X1 [Alligator mississippiensis]|uniref:pre-mRNA-splicing factor 38B-like isoform X1 n=1 Tax=Alligator mississippiensis TaxID=8496 RepID=UPI0006EC6BD8|nr:pre-mRNA-splicing factor 38B-like isoform X1 [Alligator mississippiensis]